MSSQQRSIPFRLRVSAILLVVSSLDQSSARSLEKNFNYDEIESSLSSTVVNQPVVYDATFTNLWTETNHPNSYPSSSAHWSPMVYASHSDSYRMWCDGCFATDGVELIAETGATSILVNEISSEQDTNAVLDQQTAPGSGTPVRDGQEVSPSGGLCVDKEHPLISSISMIAPSPDWFSGLYNLRLWETNSSGENVWYEKFEAFVYAWDAGTEEGDSYSLGNSPTDPKEGMFPYVVGNNEVFVSENSSDGNLQVLPVGILTFELQGQSQECNSLSMSSSVADTARRFIIRVRKRGMPKLRRAKCRKWAAKRPSNRCRKMTRHLNGTVTGIRVRELCPMTCMSK